MNPKKDLLNHFRSEYQRCLRRPYVVSWGRHLLESGRLLQEFPIDQLKTLITAYLERKGDPFDARAGRKFEFLRAQLPGLVEQLNKKLDSEASRDKAAGINSANYEQLVAARERVSQSGAAEDRRELEELRVFSDPQTGGPTDRD